MLLSSAKKVAVSGISTEKGGFYTAQLLKSGTKVIAGISAAPLTEHILKVPTYASLKELKKGDVPDILICFDDPKSIKDTVIDGMMLNIPWIIVTTDHVPLLDMVLIRQKLALSKSKLIGPSSSGILLPGLVSFSTISAKRVKRGPLGIITRSESLLLMLFDVFNVGFSQVIDIGSDPIVGMDVNQAMAYLLQDPDTKQILVVDVKQSEIKDIPYDKKVYCMIVGEDEPRVFKHVEKITSFTYLKKLVKKKD